MDDRVFDRMGDRALNRALRSLNLASYDEMHNLFGGVQEAGEVAEGSLMYPRGAVSSTCDLCIQPGQACAEAFLSRGDISFNRTGVCIDCFRIRYCDPGPGVLPWGGAGFVYWRGFNLSHLGIEDPFMDLFLANVDLVEAGGEVL